MICRMDPEAYRAEARDRWERSAAGWAQTRDAMSQTAAPATRWLLDAAALEPGQTVLEVAAGPGEVGLAAASLVAPSGRVIITDGAAAMVELARARAIELGIDNVETRAMEAEWLDLPTASVDAVLSRFGYMLLVDPEAGLREARRVLRAGGRIALAVWGAAEHNVWLTLVNQAARDLGFADPPDPSEPGPFALAAPGALRAVLDTAGFADVEIACVDVEFSAADLDGWWEQLTLSSVRLSELTKRLQPAQHYALRDAFDTAYAPFVGAGGAVRIPGEVLVAAALA